MLRTLERISGRKVIYVGDDWIAAGHANHSSAVINSSASVQRAWAQQLAAFLIGAGNTSYFYASDTWTRTYKDPTGEHSQKDDMHPPTTVATSLQVVFSGGVLRFAHGVFACDMHVCPLISQTRGVG